MLNENSVDVIDRNGSLVTGVMSREGTEPFPVATHSAAPFNDGAFPELNVVAYMGRSGDINYRQLCEMINDQVVSRFGGNTTCQWFIDEATVLRAWETTLCDEARNQIRTINPEGRDIPIVARYQATVLQTYRLLWGSFVNRQLVEGAIKEYLAHLKASDNDCAEKVAKIVKDIRDAINQIQYDVFIQRIVALRGAKQIKYERDMFAATPSVDIEGTTATFKMPHREYKISDAVLESCNKMGRERLKEYVRDYRKFMPMFKPTLDYIVWQAFATYSKDSYMLFRIATNGGKGFIQGMLSRGKIMFKTTYEQHVQMIAQKPVGVNPDELMNALTLGIDEARAITNADKAATTHISLNIKHGASMDIRVCSKLYFCHAEMNSLTSGGLDAEMVGRFVAVPEFNKDLTQHPMYRDNKQEYTDAVELYAINYVNVKIKELQGMGREAAATEANQNLKQFYSEYNLAAQVGQVKDNLEWVADEVLRAIMQVASITAPVKPQGSLTAIEQLYDAPKDKQPVVVVPNLLAVVEQVINAVVSKSEVVKYSRYKNEIANMLTPRNNDSRKGKNLYRSSGERRIRKRGVHLPLDIELQDIAECWDARGRRVESTAKCVEEEENDN